MSAVGLVVEKCGKSFGKDERVILYFVRFRADSVSCSSFFVLCSEPFVLASEKHNERRRTRLALLTVNYYRCLPVSSSSS